MKIVISIFVLPFILGLDLMSCNLVSSNNTNVQKIPKNSKKYLHNNSLKIEDIINQVENAYYSFTYFKANGQNVYTKKGISNESSVKKTVQIEYYFPSQIKALLQDENGEIKTFISHSNTAYILFNAQKIKDFDDIYWGLTSTEFGGGTYFETVKILILKERNRDRNSVFQNLVDIKLIGEEEINGKPCYKIQGSLKTDELISETFWIDKESFLILQFERMMLARKIPNGYSKTVETYLDIEAR